MNSIGSAVNLDDLPNHYTVKNKQKKVNFSFGGRNGRTSSVAISEDPKYYEISQKIGRPIDSKAYDNFNKQM
jgi:hypothetical protein